MRARSLARRLALALGLPLAVAGGTACKKSEPQRERPNRPVASADHEAQCERGTFCVPPQSSMELAAPPPFERCSVITPLPPGVPAGWEQTRRAKLRISFQGDTTAATRKSDPEACCYEWREHCAGRPLRDGVRALVAPAVAEGAGWAEGAAAMETPPQGRARRADRRGRTIAGEITQHDRQDRADRRARAAAFWLENALLEHASIAAFAQAALDLLALGAPADLVAGAHAAALDEVRHAQGSFAMAASLGASASGPGPMPEVARALRPTSPDRMLQETFRDGCIGEAAAALVLAAAARRAAPPFRETLSRMAEDEARHAELAWRTVHWLVRTFPSAAEALQAEAHRMHSITATSTGMGGRRRQSLLEYGVWDAGTMLEARSRTARRIAVPLVGEMLRGMEPQVGV